MARPGAFPAHQRGPAGLPVTVTGLGTRCATPTPKWNTGQAGRRVRAGQRSGQRRGPRACFVCWCPMRTTTRALPFPADGLHGAAGRTPSSGQQRPAATTMALPAVALDLELEPRDAVVEVGPHGVSADMARGATLWSAVLEPPRLAALSALSMPGRPCLASGVTGAHEPAVAQRGTARG